MKSITNTCTFQTCLMYKPEGDSIWVSLEYITWGWSGTATQIVHAVWKAGDQAHWAQNAQPTDVLPVWNRNLTDIQNAPPKEYYL